MMVPSDVISPLKGISLPRSKALFDVPGDAAARERLMCRASVVPKRRFGKRAGFYSALSEVFWVWGFAGSEFSERRGFRGRENGPFAMGIN